MAGFAGSSSVCSSGSSVRKKRKATSSCYDYQDNLNLKKKGKSSQQTSESALDQVKQGIPTSYELEKLSADIGEDWIKLGRRLGVSNAKLKEIYRCHNHMSEKGYHMLIHWSEKNGSDATYQALCDGLLNDLVQRRDLAEKFCYIIVKNKFEEEQEGTYDVYGDTVKDTSTVNGDDDCINTPYFHSDNELQQSVKPLQITSTINEDNVNVTYIHGDSELQQSSKAIRIGSYSLKRESKGKKGYSVVVIKHTKYEKVMEYKFDYKDIDFDHVIKIVDIKDISDCSLVIVINKCNISTSPVDIQTGDKKFKKLEAQMGDDTCCFTITIWGDQTSAVDLQIGKKELLKNLEAERGDDTYSITVTFWEDQVRKFKNQLTYIINIQGTKGLSLNSDSKIVQIANGGESLFEVNSSLAIVEVISISCVGEINRFFRCKKCSEKLMPCQGNLQQCTVCRMKQLSDNSDTDISVILFLREPKLSLTIFRDQLDNIVKIYNEDNNEDNKLATLTDTTLEKIILYVRNVKIHYDKYEKKITDIQKM